MRHVLISWAIFSFTLGACSLVPMASAGLGAGVGALGGPGTAVAGGMLGQAAGEMLIAPGEKEDLVKTVAASLSLEDVNGLVARKVDEQTGFFDGVLAEVYGLIKLLAIGTLFVVLIPLLYTWHRKRKAEPFYKKVEDMLEDYE